MHFKQTTAYRFHDSTNAIILKKRILIFSGFILVVIIVVFITILVSSNDAIVQSVEHESEMFIEVESERHRRQRIKHDRTHTHTHTHHDGRSNHFNQHDNMNDHAHHQQMLLDIHETLMPQTRIQPKNDRLFNLYEEYIPQQSITQFIHNNDTAHMTVKRDMNGDRVVFADENKGLIYGNPLLLNECRFALYSEMEQKINFLNDNTQTQTESNAQQAQKRQFIFGLADGSGEYFRQNTAERMHLNWTQVLSKQEKAMPWFWSRESFSTALSLRQKRDIVWLTDRSKAQSNGYKQYNSSTYFNIPKTASSTMQAVCKEHNQFAHSNNAAGRYVQSQCGFTLIRNPVSRFVSGYYTVNRLMFGNEKLSVPAYVKFWKVNGEPQRFRQFVDDMIEHVSDFMRVGPLMHMMTQTAILTLGQFDLHFLLRFESMKEHYNTIAKLPNCNLKPMAAQDWPHHMSKVGGSKNKKRKRIPRNAQFNVYENRTYEHMMGFDDPSYLAINTTLDAAWFAIDLDTYSKIVDFFKQDYICFRYKADYQKDVIHKIEKSMF